MVKFSTSSNSITALPKIMLIDMNSYFASVEQQANPFLRGRPVGVVASLHSTSCIIAASVEAKQQGVKTGTLIYQAKKLIPDIVLIKQDPDKYRVVNRRISKIIDEYTDCVENYSIDEWFLELNPNIEFSVPNPLLVAIEIKQRIRKEVGEWLACSIGVAPNKFMAKLAVDLQKRDGLTVVWRENLPEIYKQKKLSDLWGIAQGWESRLGRLGIVSPAQLLECPHSPISDGRGEARPKGAAVQNLISLYGKPGFYIWQRVNGLERDVILSGTKDLNPRTDSSAKPQNDTPKSFGHSWVLNFRTTDKSRLAPVILRLAEKAARRMRRGNYMACGIYIRIRFIDGTSLSRIKKLKYLVSSGLELYQEAMLIWKAWQFKHEVIHIAVGFHSLVHRFEQLVLFGSGSRLSSNTIPVYSSTKSRQGQDAWRSLVDSIDKINDKYGEFTIRSGLLTKTQSFAPDAIAFGR